MEISLNTKNSLIEEVNNLLNINKLVNETTDFNKDTIYKYISTDEYISYYAVISSILLAKIRYILLSNDKDCLKLENFRNYVEYEILEKNNFYFPDEHTCYFNNLYLCYGSGYGFVIRKTHLKDLIDCYINFKLVKPEYLKLVVNLDEIVNYWFRKTLKICYIFNIPIVFKNGKIIKSSEFNLLNDIYSKISKLERVDIKREKLIKSLDSAVVKVIKNRMKDYAEI